jgi:hypothetical protein
MSNASKRVPVAAADSPAVVPGARTVSGAPVAATR